jgi:hypothetical protein
MWLHGEALSEETKWGVDVVAWRGVVGGDEVGGGCGCMHAHLSVGAGSPLSSSLGELHPGSSGQSLRTCMRACMHQRV